MTDLNAPLDPTERDALAWRMLEEGLDMAGADLQFLKASARNPDAGAESRVFAALHDALAYRRQT